MCLIHQHCDAPLIEQGQAVEQGVHVEVVVVVTHHHIGPTAELLAKVVGADLVFQGDASHLRLRQPGLFQRCQPCRRQAVIKALGQRAGLTVAAFIRMLAGFVAGHMLQYPQRNRLIGFTQAV